MTAGLFAKGKERTGEPLMILAENLTRKYGTFTAVEDVSFKIAPGEIVGLLGHNGAGKTTIMKMLTGYLEPTAGTITIDGHDVETDREAVQALIGYLPENCPVYPEMTVVDFLDYAAELKGVPDAGRPAALSRVIRATGLTEKATEPISSLSRGLRQRVGVAQAILHRPKIVILDEPTNGLDPSQIKHMRTLIKSLAENATVILSTHILQEVQSVCDRVIIVNRGRLALDASLADLNAERRLRVVTNGAPDALGPLVADFDGALKLNTLPDAGKAHAYRLDLGDRTPEDVAPKIARLLNDKGFDLIALHPEERDLETVFAEITTKEAAIAEVAHA
jgi:ABC-2 type transport system ATP-binding protein